MKVVNAKSLPQRFFGLHMVSGVAEYAPTKDKSGERVLVTNDAINSMAKSFEGLPVYVRHVPEVKLETLQTDADGFVVRTFFNPADGNHWCEFLVVSDEAKQKIAGGWKLSNCYTPTSSGAGGLCNGVKYEREILSGVYDHLAIVPDPRYEESIILTPEEFKKYNEEKEMQLLKLANSKTNKERPKMFKMFKREKLENSVDYENMVIELPKSKKEIILSKLVNEADEMEMKKDEVKMANMEDMVDCGANGKMKLNELVAKYEALHNELMEMKKNAAPAPKEVEMSPEEKEKKANAEKEKMEKEELEKKANAEKEKVEVEKKANALWFEQMDQAPLAALQNSNDEGPVVDLAIDQVARGKARYGSK